MKTFKVIVFRHNPQLTGGGYPKEFVVRAKTADNAASNVMRRLSKVNYGYYSLRSCEELPKEG